MTTKIPHLKMLPEPISSRPRDESTSSSSMSGKDGNSNQDAEEGVHKFVSHASCLGFPEEGNISSRRCAAADASTQTDIGMPPLHGSTATTSTLESLIKVNATAKTSGENRRVVDTERGGGGGGNGEEEAELQWRSKMKGGGNALMQLFSCGSISVKDGGGGFPTYRPRSSHSKFPSPLLMFGELDCLSRSHGLMQLKMEDKEYFSGSLIETRTHNSESDSSAALKRCSSYNAERTCKEEEKGEKEENGEKGGTAGSSSLGMSKCIPRSIKVSLSKQNPRSESMRSPVEDPPRNSLDGNNQRAAVCSKRINSFGESVVHIHEC